MSGVQVVLEDGIEKIANTINYETVYEICRLQMKQPQKLLETVLDNILLMLKWQFATIQTVKMRIRKLNPPVGGTVAWSLIEKEISLVSQCGRCGRAMICYNDATCWCQELREKIHPRTMEMLKGQFKGCLCERCLKEFSG
ncbi:MAG: hypothetical protein HC817_15360 [Saprospiraceae bacterium]|nr:hypothetical protein [Saprospiraceae bacterium]